MPPPPLLSPGTMAAVYWIDGRFYAIRVRQAVPGGFQIEFADSVVQTVPAANIVAFPPRPEFRAGDEVLAVWKSDVMFPGTITATSPAGYTVGWHDGDTPLIVPPGALTFLAWAQAAIKNPIPTTELTIFIPGAIMPVDRGARFAEPLQDALNAIRLGDVVDEGTKVVQAEGSRPNIEGCWITVRVRDVPRGLFVIRDMLTRADAPESTTITEHGPQEIVHALRG